MLWKINSNFKAQYYKTLVSAYRTYHTQGLFELGGVALELDKVYILPNVVVKNPNETLTGVIPETNLSIWDFLGKIEEQPAYRRIILIGYPCYGKTLLLEYLTLIYAQNQQRKVYAKAPKLIPVLLYLRQIRKLIASDRSLSISEIITKLIKRESSLKLDPPPQWFEDKLDHGKCLVMLDGLDEILDNEERKIVSDWLDLQIELYPENCYIITSRPHSYLHNSFTQTTICLELQPYNWNNSEKFLENFYIQSQLLQQAHKEDSALQEQAVQKAKKMAKILKNEPKISLMASNPLLLTIIALCAQNIQLLLKKRIELYEIICHILLEKRPKAKGITSLYNLQEAQIKSILQVLALELMFRQKTQFTLEEGTQIIGKILTTIVQDENASVEFLEYIENITGLLQQIQPQVYQFTYLSFQEYLAAVQIKKNNQEQILIDNIDQEWWSETIRLYSALSDTTKLIIAAWNKRTVLTMTLAYDCWEEGKNVHPELRQRLENWLEAALESNDPEIARLAAKVQLSRRLKYAVAAD